MTRTVLGILASFFTVITLFPQILKIYKTHHTKDLALSTYLILTTAAGLWVLYGLLIRDVAVAATNSVVFMTSLTVTILKLKLG